MGNGNLYSKQQRAKTNPPPAIYRHDIMPMPLRNQIVQIWDEAIGTNAHTLSFAERLFQTVRDALRKEYGVAKLVDMRSPMHFGPPTFRQQVRKYFLTCQDVNRLLDVVQLVFIQIDTLVRREPREFKGSRTSPDRAIKELNERFREHGTGFQYSRGQIFRVDSGLAYQQMTVPALNLLQQPYLRLANEEFLAGHEHFRHRRYKECLNECLKAFESTMKAICDKRKWPYNQNDNAKTLIKICEDNGLFPVFMESHLSGLRSTLESGVPTARNKTSGHGQGVKPIKVSEAFASYVLNLTAANVLFLAASEQELT